MREMLFRGKTIGNEWVYGNLIVIGDCCFINKDMGFNKTVIPETVGQYTGLKDKNGKRIFESDIVNCKTTIYFFENCKVVYRNSLARYCVVDTNELIYPMDEGFEYEIIGNVFDNPELFERGVDNG